MLRWLLFLGLSCALWPFTLLYSILFTKQDASIDGVSATQLLSDELPNGRLYFIVHVLMDIDFEGGVTILRRVVKQKICSHVRFLQRPVFSWFCPPYWKFSSGFDITQHVLERTINHDELPQLLQSSMQEGLDVSTGLPPWRIYLLHVRKASGADRRQVLFLFHHSLADGFNMARLMITSFTSYEQLKEGQHVAAKLSRKRAAELEAQTETAKKSKKKSVMTTLTSRAVGTLWKIFVRLPDRPSDLKSRTPLHCRDPLRVGLSVASAGVEQIKCACHTANMRLAQKSGGTFDVSERITVNDVLLTALAEAVSRSRAISPDGTAAAVEEVVLTAVWASLSPLSSLYAPCDKTPPSFGNSKLGLLYMPLPIRKGTGNSEDEMHSTLMDRLGAVHSRTVSLKTSLEPLIGNFAMRVVGNLPPVLLRALWPILSSKATIACSAMPLPHWPLRMGRDEIEAIHFFVPPQQRLGIVVTMISYNDSVCFSVTADARLLQGRTNAFMHLCETHFNDSLSSLLQEMEGTKGNGEVNGGEEEEASNID